MQVKPISIVCSLSVVLSGCANPIEAYPDARSVLDCQMSAKEDQLQAKHQTAIVTGDGLGTTIGVAILGLVISEGINSATYSNRLQSCISRVSGDGIVTNVSDANRATRVPAQSQPRQNLDTLQPVGCVKGGGPFQGGAAICSGY